MTYEEVLSRFDNVVRTGEGQASARCPGHPDKKNSLSISRGDDGRTLLNCFVKCRTDMICAQRGLTMRDLFADSPPRSNANGNGNDGSSHSSSESQGSLTLATFAAAKGFTVEYLTHMGVSEEGKKLLFHYLLADGQRAPRTRIRFSLNGTPPPIWAGVKSRPIAAYGLWRLREARKHDVANLYLVEGESDSLTLWLHGYCAIGIPGASMCKVLASAHIAGFKRIYIVREHDKQGGEVFEQGMTGRLAELQCRAEVYVVEMSKIGLKDPNDLHTKWLGDAGAFEAEWNELTQQARKLDLALTGLEVLSMNTVAPARLAWVWERRLALGKIAIYAGDPGESKSLASLDLAARVSTGRKWPDGAPAFGPADVLVFSGEDSPSDTIRPRLDALGADASRISVVKCNQQRTPDGEMVSRGFNLATDMPDLERAIDQMPAVRVVIIDPLSEYLGRADGNSNTEMRGLILAPLAAFAEKHNLLVLIITHLNKGSGSAKHRLSGSIGIIGAARMVWLFTPDSTHDNGNPAEQHKLMIPIKLNLSAAKGLGFTTISCPNNPDVPTIMWKEGVVLDTAEDVLAAQAEQRGGSDVNKQTQACELLRRMLAKGPLSTSSVEEEARLQGFSTRTMERARKFLGIKTRQTGFHGGWVMYLP